MSLRAKLVLTLTLLTAAATITVGALGYVATSRRLHHEVDRSLDQAAEVVRARPGLGTTNPWRPRRPGPEADMLPIAALEQIVVQVIGRDGEVVTASSETELPVGPTDVAIASGGPGSVQPYRTVTTTEGASYRVLTVPLGPDGAAIQLGRNLDETDRLLDSLRNVVALAVVIVTAVAALVGWIVARQITRRLVRLTSVAETVADTGRLDIEVPVEGRDETGRLGTAFDKMLSALSRSRDAQRRLVQDAGHELRTPLTSLRTNVSVLRRHDDLPDETRQQVLSDLEAESRQLSTLVNEIVELATDNRKDEPVTTVALGALVEDVAERARRRSSRIIQVEADTSEVQGRRLALERAVTNLLDNAVKFDERGSPVLVTVAGGRVEVCDRGEGIDPGEVELVFDRFHRSVTARSRPGSGLGLAIVRDIAESHGGTVFAAPRDGGGACVGFTLPVTGGGGATITPGR